MVTPASPIEAGKPFRHARGVRAEGPFLPRNADLAFFGPLCRSVGRCRLLVFYLVRRKGPTLLHLQLGLVACTNHS